MCHACDMTPDISKADNAYVFFRKLTTGRFVAGYQMFGSGKHHADRQLSHRIGIGADTAAHLDSTCFRCF